MKIELSNREQNILGTMLIMFLYLFSFSFHIVYYYIIYISYDYQSAIEWILLFFLSHVVLFYIKMTLGNYFGQTNSDKLVTYILFPIIGVFVGLIALPYYITVFIRDFYLYLIEKWRDLKQFYHYSKLVINTAILRDEFTDYKITTVRSFEKVYRENVTMKAELEKLEVLVKQLNSELIYEDTAGNVVWKITKCSYLTCETEFESKFVNNKHFQQLRCTNSCSDHTEWNDNDLLMHRIINKTENIEKFIANIEWKKMTCRNVNCGNIFETKWTNGIHIVAHTPCMLDRCNDCSKWKKTINEVHRMVKV